MVNQFGYDVIEHISLFQMYASQSLPLCMPCKSSQELALTKVLNTNVLYCTAHIMNIAACRVGGV
jgi:hypothetical protein